MSGLEPGLRSHPGHVVGHGAAEPGQDVELVVAGRNAQAAASRQHAEDVRTADRPIACSVMRDEGKPLFARHLAADFFELFLPFLDLRIEWILLLRRFDKSLHRLEQVILRIC